MNDPRERKQVRCRSVPPRLGRGVLVALAAGLAASGLSARAAAQSLDEAKALFDSGKYSECLQMSERGVKEYPWYESWRHQKIDAELTLGRYADALATAEKGIEDFPSSIRLRLAARQAYRRANRPNDAQRMLAEVDMLIRQAPWRYNNSADKIAVGEIFLSQGMDARDVLEICYDKVKVNSPTFLGSYLATGELGLDKHDYALAAEAFGQAAKLDPTNPQVHYGLARAYRSSDPDAAEAALRKALELNGRHVPSLLLAADQLVDSEQYDKARKALALALEVNPTHPLSCAYLAVLAHLDGDSQAEKQWRDKAFSSWPADPEVDHVIGWKLSQKYRFAEGARCQRQALALDAGYLPAKIQLAQDLLRLGEDAEGWRLVEEVSDEDGYNVLAYNLVTLRETLETFETIEDGGIAVRMAAGEADIYGRAALKLLGEAKRVLCEKYGVELPRKVVVEIFPAQKDFAVRTFGMPGGAGFLGVCFGPLITVNSPASQGAKPANWRAVLWHEFCHAVTLEKTKNKMPRWLSEGISVYEERRADPIWGESMGAAYRKMVLDGELTPVSELSGAFLKPASPLHLQFAYFESALVVEFLVEKHGFDALRKILDDLAGGAPINTALDRHAGGLAELDRQFAEHARRRAEGLAPDADWTAPELPAGADLEALRKFAGEHPANLAGLTLFSQKLIDEGRWQEAQPPLERLVAIYPENTAADGPYRLLAEVHRKRGDPQAERSVLEKLASLDAAAVDVFLRLVELCEAAGDWQGVMTSADRILAVNPLLPGPHRALAAAAERLDLPERAIEAYRALLCMDPIDPARMHYQLASLLFERGNAAEAKRQVLMALEEAPRYRDAQRLLLALVDGGEGDAEAPDAIKAKEVAP